MSDWDTVNTFLCVRRGGKKTTPEHCREFRSRPEAPIGLSDTEEAQHKYKPEACVSCKSCDEMIRQVEQKRRNEKNQSSGSSPKDPGTEEPGPGIPKGYCLCRECGHVERHVGRGLGGRCYQRLNKAGELDTKYPRAEPHMPRQEKNLLRRHDLVERRNDALPVDRAALSLTFPLPVSRQRVDQIINQLFQNREELF